MEVQEKQKAIKMATTTSTTTTLGYPLPNRDSSSPSASPSASASPSPSPTINQRRTGDQLAPASKVQVQVQGHTLLVFNDPIQSQNSNNNNNHHAYGSHPLAPVQQRQQEEGGGGRRSTDPDLISSSHVTEGEERRSKTILYRECLRNHAASMGSHVVDGCGEFMASGEEGTQESLKCAACECHRNFHRKQIQGEQSQPQQQQQHVSNPYYSTSYPNKHNNNGHLHFSTPPLPPPLSLPHQQQQQHTIFSHVLPTPTVPPLMMAFGAGAESSSEDLNMFQCNQAQPISKKRFRTKFSQQQKDRMMEFAEKIGWKIQKHDEQEVQQFCSQLGIKRQVFKVWMHNNKQAIKKTANVS